METMVLNDQDYEKQFNVQKSFITIYNFKAISTFVQLCLLIEIHDNSNFN
jgi:hypothetical protein